MPRWQMLGLLLAILLGAIVLACLFSFLLPSSASLLPPIPTITFTITATPVPTPTATITSTAFPATAVTPKIIPFPGFMVYWNRALWETDIGSPHLIEDFEKDPLSYDELYFPYITGNGFILTGKSKAQIVRAPELLPSQNLLHFRDWEYGLTFAIPSDAATSALGFDYSSQEDWQLQVLNISIVLPHGRNSFVGVVLSERATKNFTILGPNTAQGGLSVDNVSYLP